METEIKHRHKYEWSMYDMGEGIYKSCGKCGFVPKNAINKDYWAYVESGRVSCIVILHRQQSEVEK